MDRAVRAGGEGVQCRKSESLRVGRSLEGSKLLQISKTANWAWVRGNE